jgi:hypothetical protein
MKKQNWLYGFILAAAFLMCGTSFASPFTDTGIYSEPIYDTVALTADTADPVANVTAMAGGSTDNNKDSIPGYCMAACHNDKRTSVGLSYSGLAPDYVSVLACSYVSEPVNLPTKIPITA